MNARNFNKKLVLELPQFVEMAMQYRAEAIRSRSVFQKQQRDKKELERLRRDNQKERMKRVQFFMGDYHTYDISHNRIPPKEYWVWVVIDGLHRIRLGYKLTTKTACRINISRYRNAFKALLA